MTHSNENEKRPPPEYDYDRICESNRPLMSDLRERHARTHEHSTRVVALADDMARACALRDRERIILRAAACLHDVGKIGVPDEILLKPGAFNEHERGVMRTHPEKGEHLVREPRIRDSKTVGKAVRHHHEDFAGTGYPDALAGEDIPIYARIIAVVDTYDAMTEARPYQAAKTHREALGMIHEQSGGRFDPQLVAAFARSIRFNPRRA